MNSFIGWIGGKNYLKKIICERMPPKFNRYIEVFGGAAWVLFNKDSHAEMEVYNDYNKELTNLFKCVKFHRPELQRELSNMLNSRILFEEFKAQYDFDKMKGCMTDIQRSARFFFLIKTSYGSNGRNFGCVKKNISIMKEYLKRIEERLAGVIIENKDFEDIIKVYDKPEAFFYLDPPYYGTEEYYKVQFLEKDHLRLKKKLDTLEGKYLLSYNDCEYIRDLYKEYYIEEISRKHNLVSRYPNKDQEYKELLIKNY